MMRRYLFPLVIGFAGCAILVWLGLWQLQRLDWKQDMLAEIQHGIDAQPVELPNVVNPSMKYLPVTVSGWTTGQEVLAISGSKDRGAGYQVISAFVTDDGRRVLLDRGFLPEDGRRVPRPATRLTVVGNLHWPNEVGSATPAPNLADNLWFARDVVSMSEHLETLPILIVAATVQGDNQGATARAVSIQGIPNNHLGYAVQWFGLALVWAGMTLVLIWRIRQRQF